MEILPTGNREHAHRYKVGQAVALIAGFGYAQNQSAIYKIVALLPSNGANYQYRIRSQNEDFERVAAENELQRRPEF